MNTSQRSAASALETVPLHLIAWGTLGHGAAWLLVPHPWLLDQAANEQLLQTTYHALFLQPGNAHLAQYLTGLYRFFGLWIFGIGLVMQVATRFGGDQGRRMLRVTLTLLLAVLWALQLHFIPNSPFLWTTYAMAIMLMTSAWGARERIAADGWARMAGRYDWFMRALAPATPALLAWTRAAVTGRNDVLEVGPGTGLVTMAVAESVTHYRAIEPSAAMLHQLKAKLEAANLRKVTLEQRDLFDPDEAHYDAIIAAHVLHLVADLPLAISTLRQRLRPAGVLIAPTFCHAETLLARVVSRALACLGVPVKTRLTLDIFSKALEAGGLRVTQKLLLAGPIPIGLLEATRDP